MAAREGQGLQIAVIIFAFLTIVLAITTYVFYAQAQTAMKEREATASQMAGQQTELNNLRARDKAAQLVLGIGDWTDADVVEGADTIADQIIADFNAHKATVGSQLVGNGAASYRTMQESLLAALRKRNDSVTDQRDQLRKAQSDHAAAMNQATQRVDQAEKAVTTAREEKDREVAIYTSLRDEIAKEKEKLVADAAAAQAKARTELDNLIKQRDALMNDGVTRQTTIDTLQSRVKELQAQMVDLFENPDGKILHVNQRQRLVWINVGRVDGLMRQTTFSVYPHNEHGLASATPKARIEVVNIQGDHMAEARILEDKASDPILPNDIIHTPAWSPGQRIHFAMAGVMDLNGDGIDNFETVRSIIVLSGGVIDAEIKPDGTRTGNLTTNTRYLVRGEPDTSSQRSLQEWTRLQEEIKPYGIEPLGFRQLLSMMGWKPEERTVELAGGRGSQFRQRTPGKAAPGAAADDPGAAPAPPPAGGDVDPFGAPAGADPFGGAADPFGAPAPRAPAGADPFGP